MALPQPVAQLVAEAVVPAHEARPDVADGSVPGVGVCRAGPTLRARGRGRVLARGAALARRVEVQQAPPQRDRELVVSQEVLRQARRLQHRCAGPAL